MDSLPLSLAKPLLRSVAAAMPAGARGRRFIQMLGLSPVERYQRMMTCEVDESFGALLRLGVAAGSRPGSGAFAELALQAGSDDYLSTLQYLDVRRYLPEDILTKVDRTSMLTSLETRVPLLDHVLMEHVARMPARMKMRNGSAKWVLKETMRDALPAEILNRRKMGFGVPLAGWFRKELRDFSRDVLLDSRARQRGILRTAAVEGLLAAHQEGSRDFSSELWSLICFELWCRTWWER
jgi:asparagine synthase (glutamine-hydrolysing)